MKKAQDLPRFDSEYRSPMLIGYARVSTDDQDLTMQIEALKKFGVPRDRIYTDKKSGKDLNRPGWRAARMDLRKGDTLVVWKLDRMSRSMADAVHIFDEFRNEGIELAIITDQFDTRTAMGRFCLNMLANFAELERGMISERTREGIKIAQERGHVAGPLPRITEEIWNYSVDKMSNRPDYTVPALIRDIHRDCQRPKDKPLTAGSINRVFDEIKSGEPYPEHWRLRWKQYRQRQKARRKEAKK